MSQLEVDKIIPQSGTTLTIGDSGDTISFAEGTNLGIDTNTLVIDSTNNRVGIKNASPTVELDVTGDVKVAGNINLGDNDKAQFGASNDLQIYHDGSNSIIHDNGTGNLRIQATNFEVANGAYTKSYIFATDGAEVTLKYNGNNKLSTTNTGIDVTGTVVSDGLTVNGDIKASRFYTSTGASGSSTNIPATSQGDGWTILQFKSQAGNTDANYIEFDGLNPGGSNQSNSWIGARYNGNWSSNLEFYSAKQTNTSINNYDSALSARFSQPTITFFTGTAGTSDTTEAMRIDSSGNVGIGTSSPSKELHVYASSGECAIQVEGVAGDAGLNLKAVSTSASFVNFGDESSNNVGQIYYSHPGNTMQFKTNGSERMRIDSSGDVMIGKTSASFSTKGFFFNIDPGQADFVGQQANPIRINRLTDDGVLVSLQQDGSQEGTISVSGATVSYNGFTGTHWSRLADNSKPTILKGTILESLDEMMDWYQVQFDITDDEGNTTTQKESYALGDGESVGDVITYNHEGTDYQGTIIQESDVKHTKSKISDTVDAKNVYGVFVDWDNDDDTVNDMYVAQTGTFVVRMNSAETVSKGDLIQSNGDGTGKVQADDIIRSSTVAKILSTTKIETYEDGSYIVPCSLHC